MDKTKPICEVCGEGNWTVKSYKRDVEWLGRQGKITMRVHHCDHCLGDYGTASDMDANAKAMVTFRKMVEAGVAKLLPFPLSPIGRMKLTHYHSKYGPHTSNTALELAIECSETCKALGAHDHAFLRFKQEEQDYENYAVLLEIKELHELHEQLQENEARKDDHAV